MKTISAAEFKARCLNLMEAVRKTRETVLITKRGKPVAKLVPADKPSANLIGRLFGTRHGDSAGHSRFDMDAGGAEAPLPRCRWRDTKRQEESSIAVSAITLWEVASLVTRGRIHAYGTVEASVRLLTEGIVLKMITPEIAAVAAQFTADFPRDPAGRLIAAMARVESIPLITRDEGLRSSPLLQTIW